MGNLLALVEGEFLVLNCFLDSDGGPFVDFKVKVAGMGAEGFGVDGCDVELAFVFLSDGLQLFGESSALFLCFGENVAQGDSSLRNWSVFVSCLYGR